MPTARWRPGNLQLRNPFLESGGVLADPGVRHRRVPADAILQLTIEFADGRSATTSKHPPAAPTRRTQIA